MLADWQVGGEVKFYTDHSAMKWQLVKLQRKAREDKGKKRSVSHGTLDMYSLWSLTSVPTANQESIGMRATVNPSTSLNYSERA